ncbi:putative Mitogen-activated protein kinase kinase kinase 7 [Hypsibius exemplaris]|uniref:Mitogen-activated protein kinase kinase kinase 7 n=1 Tax=Hypsibius exemplaris TaxID=2072580 RepID=A0A9X6RP01_HYPEX|nr:putative Mitogen-activated protein kinase kinase kinase 7 [Hypsibius exemplaris]
MSEDSRHVPYPSLTLLECLGKGGFGEVHKALWNGTTVAVKKALLSTPSVSTQQRELDILFRINHPNIVKVIGLTYENESAPPAIVMEYAVNGSLKNYIHSQNADVGPQYTWQLIISLLHQMCCGVEYLHKMGVVHRDLKTDNVLLFDEFLTAKLCDFGLAREVTKETSNNNQGTVHYMAPELIGRKADAFADLNLAEPDPGPSYSPKSDIYSIGIIIWEALSRCVPFADLNGNLQIMQAVRNGKRPFRLVGCPDLMKTRLMTPCLSGDPALRPSIKSLCSGLELCKRSSASLPLKRHINARLDVMEVLAQIENELIQEFAHKPETIKQLRITANQKVALYIRDTDLHAFFATDKASALLDGHLSGVLASFGAEKSEREQEVNRENIVIGSKEVLTLLDKSALAHPEWAEKLSALVAYLSIHFVLQQAGAGARLLDNYLNLCSIPTLDQQILKAFNQVKAETKAGTFTAPEKHTDRMEIPEAKGFIDTLLEVVGERSGSTVVEDILSFVEGIKPEMIAEQSQALQGAGASPVEIAYGAVAGVLKGALKDPVFSDFDLTDPDKRDELLAKWFETVAANPRRPGQEEYFKKQDWDKLEPMFAKLMDSAKTEAEQAYIATPMAEQKSGKSRIDLLISQISNPMMELVGDLTHATDADKELSDLAYEVLTETTTAFQDLAKLPGAQKGSVQAADTFVGMMNFLQMKKRTSLADILDRLPKLLDASYVRGSERFTWSSQIALRSLHLLAIRASINPQYNDQVSDTIYTVVNIILQRGHGEEQYDRILRALNVATQSTLTQASWATLDVLIVLMARSKCGPQHPIEAALCFYNFVKLGKKAFAQTPSRTDALFDFCANVLRENADDSVKVVSMKLMEVLVVSQKGQTFENILPRALRIAVEIAKERTTSSAMQERCQLLILASFYANASETISVLSSIDESTRPNDRFTIFVIALGDHLQKMSSFFELKLAALGVMAFLTNATWLDNPAVCDAGVALFPQLLTMFQKIEDFRTNRGGTSSLFGELARFPSAVDKDDIDEFAVFKDFVDTTVRDVKLWHSFCGALGSQQYENEVRRLCQVGDDLRFCLPSGMIMDPQD